MEGGVHSMRLIDLTGHKYGALTVLRRAENQGRRTMWLCRCECGKEVVVRGENIRSGNTRSCGCLAKDNPKKHGMSKTRLAYIFRGMKQRCYNPNNHEYWIYGGRGIKICPEWLEDPMNFYQWALESGFDEAGNQRTCSIDRIDFNGDYSPDNCRWADIYTQANNTRKNIYYIFGGEKHTLSEWSRITGIGYGTLYDRINKLGWSVEKALTHPV